MAMAADGLVLIIIVLLTVVHTTADITATTITTDITTDITAATDMVMREITATQMVMAAGLTEEEQ
jgi:hypothetical protein